MAIAGIDSKQIDSMLTLLRSMASQTTAPSGLGEGVTPIQTDTTGGVGSSAGTAKVSFADALKNSLNEVNQVQLTAQKMGDQFAAGDDSVSLSDLMIEGQKASISLQTTVQVRNKMVAAYTDIMNMQI